MEAIDTNPQQNQSLDEMIKNKKQNTQKIR